MARGGRADLVLSPGRPVPACTARPASDEVINGHDISTETATRDDGLHPRGASRRSRGRKASPTGCASAPAAWETYESLPMPKRTDEEWRRTDLRGLKLDRLAPFAGLDGDRRRLARRLLAAAERRRRRGADAIGRAGVVVQRDAATIYIDARSASCAAQGVIFTDLDTAVREHPELVQHYFMTQAVPVDVRQVRGAARRVLAGRHVPLRAEGRRGRAAVPLVPLDHRSRARRSSPTPWSCSRRAPRRSWSMPTSRETQDGQSFASAVVELIVGEDAQAALRPGAGLGPPRLELHDRAGGPRQRRRR